MKNEEIFKNAWNYLCDADDETNDVDETELDKEGEDIIQAIFDLRMRLEKYLLDKGIDY